MSNKDVQDFIDNSMRKRVDPEKSTIIIIDETGTPGKEPTKDDTIFAMAATITEEPERFGEISQQLTEELQSRGKYIKEVKYKKSTEEDKNSVLDRIAEVDNTKTYGLFIDKAANDNPEWWKIRSREIAHRKVLGELVDVVLKDNDHLDLTVVLDDHQSYSKGAGERTVKRRAREQGKNVIVHQEDSRTGPNKKVLQTHDFVTGALGEFARTEKDLKTKKIGMKPERIRRKNKG